MGRHCRGWTWWWLIVSIEKSLKAREIKKIQVAECCGNVEVWSILLMPEYSEDSILRECSK